MADIRTQLTEVLETYTDEVVEQISADAKDCANGLRKDISGGSPHKTGSYAKGWKVKKIKTGSSRSVAFTVHNATDFQKTHLLEKGHCGPNGSPRSTAPKVHIKPAEEKWKEEFYHRCEEACKR